MVDIQNIKEKFVWILSETKLRAFEVELFLKKNNKDAEWRSLTVLDGLKNIASSLNQETRTNKPQQAELINSLILEEILNNSEFPELKEELSLVFEESNPNLKLKNLNYLLTAFRNFSNALRIQQNVDSVIKEIIDESGNTLEKKQKIAELIQLSNNLNFKLKERKITDDITSLDNLLLDLNTSKKTNLKLPELIIVDEASSYSKLELEILSQISKYCKIELLIKEPFLQIAELKQKFSFKELLNSLPPSKKHFCSLIYNINRYKNQLSFKEVKNHNQNAEKLIAYLFDSQPLENKDYKFKLPLAIWKNKTPREEVTRLAKSLSNILKNNLAKPEELHLICLDLDEYQPLFEEIFTEYQIPFVVPRGKRLVETTLGNFYLSYLSWFFKPTLLSLEKLCREPLFKIKDFDQPAIFNFISLCKNLGCDNNIFLEDIWENYFLSSFTKKGDSQSLATINWIKSELTENSELLRITGKDFFRKIFRKLNRFRCKFKKGLLAQNQVLKERAFLAATAQKTKILLKELSENTYFESSDFNKLGIEKSVFSENLILEKLKSEFLPLVYEEEKIIVSEMLDSRGLSGKLNIVLAPSFENFPAKNLKQQFSNEYDELSYKIQETSGNNSSIYESYSLIANLISNSRELVFSFSSLSKNKETKPADFLFLLAKQIKENKNLNSPEILKDYSVEFPKKFNNNPDQQKSIEQLLSKQTNYFTAYDSFIGAESSSEKIVKQLNKRFLRSSAEPEDQIAHYSVSSLETFADCPQKFFFSCLLGLEESIEPAKILAIETGNVVHTCLKKIFSLDSYKTITAENFGPACKDLLEIAEREFENNPYDWNLNYKWRYAKNLIIQGLDQDSETSKRGYLKAALFYNKQLIKSIPDQLEWNFGKDSESPALKIIEDQRELRVLGKIDRIDRTDRNKNSEVAAIWDYKTGAITPYNKVEKGKSLQIPLYALAVKQNIAPYTLPKRGAIFSLKQTNRNDEDLASFHKGVLMEHLAISRKGSRLVEDFSAVEKQCQNVKENVLKLDAALRAGEFQQKPDSEDCTYCKFKNICQRNETLIKIKSNHQEIKKEQRIFEKSVLEFLEHEKNNKELIALSAEQEAACDINHNIALIAAAGSGKTTVLIRRIIKLILAGESILSIVAITYTEKAAEEIKQRLSSAINTILEYNSLAGQQITNSEREFLISAKSLLPLAPIGTIHSFAGILLGLDPLIAKSPFSFKIVTGEERKKIAQAAIEKVLQKNPKNLLIKLLNFGLSWRNIESELAHLMLLPRDLFALNRTYKDPLILKNILEKLSTETENPELNKQGLEIAECFCELAEYTYQKYLELKKEEAVLDFDDLIISAKECLSNNSSKRIALLKERSTKLFRHFLVDEFQDTDSYQWEIIKNIASEIFSQKKTKPKENLRQTILIVGDPQQAIYGFRGGDSSIFQQAISEFKSVGGKLLFLRNNYRSEENLINFYNSYFSELFSCDFFEDASSRVSTATSYEEMYTSQKSADTQINNVSFLLKDPEMNIDEAAYLASFLKKYLAENPATENIAILCRKNDHLEKIASQLDLQNIDYNITQSNRTLELSEIKQLENLLKYLYNPQDSIALVGLLRSTIFGFSDQDLFLFYQELQDSWEIKEEYLKTAIFLNAAQKLAHWKNLNKYLSASDLLKHIIQEQNLEDVYLQANETAAYKNITMFIDTLSREGKNALVGPAVSDVLSWLELKSSSNFQLFVNKENQKISLMTIHNAKGLEFDLVILAYMNYRLPPKHDFVIGEYATNKLLGIKVEDDEDSFSRAKTPLQNLIEQSSTALICAEERRLFYVACTRAKKSLLFSFDQRKGFLGNQKKVKALSLSNRKTNAFLKSNPYYWFEQLLDYENPSFTLANPLKKLNLPVIEL